MNYDPCSAAKDCLRTYYCVLDDITYALVRGHCGGNISENFIAHITPLQKAAAALSENLLDYSTFAPIRDIAELIGEEKKRSIRNMRSAFRTCPHRESSAQAAKEYKRRYDIIRDRMTDEMRCAEMSERINSDFIRQMLPLLEGEIRLAENALCFDLCPALVPYARSVIESNKGLITAMRKLICILDQSCG